MNTLTLTVQSGCLPCCGGCCWYPASFAYPSTDLPDIVGDESIRGMTYFNSHFPAGTYAGAPADVVAAGEYAFWLGDSGTALVVTYIGSDGLWHKKSYQYQTDGGDPINPWTFLGETAFASCLINVTGGSPGVQAPGWSPPTHCTDGTFSEDFDSATLGRCVETSPHFKLFYNSTTFKWNVAGSGGAAGGQKNSPQNSPIGSYTNGLTVS